MIYVNLYMICIKAMKGFRETPTISETLQGGDRLRLPHTSSVGLSGRWLDRVAS